MSEYQDIFARNKHLRIFKSYIKFNNMLMSLMGFIMFAVMFAMVVARYVLHKDFNTASEYLYFALVWLFFLGGATASFEKSHLRADTLEVLIKNKKILLVVEWIKQVLQMILHFIFLLFSIKFIVKAVQIPAYTSVLRLPIMIGYSAVLYGAVTMLVYTAIHFYDFLWQFFHNRSAAGADREEGEQ